MKKTNIECWEKILENPPTSYKKWFREEKKYLEKHIKKNSNILDVACGDGKGLRDILHITKHLTGIDHDKKAVEDATRNFKDYPDIKIIQAEAANLPFRDDEFDFIICMGSFTNFGTEKFKILKEMKRVLRKDGSIIISVYSEDAFEERLKLYKRIDILIKEIKGTTVIFDKSLGDDISEQFSKKQLLDLFDKVGLIILDMRKVGIAYLCRLKNPP